MYKVLIADDEELELKSLRIFLERNYPEIEILPDAQNGTQMIEIALQDQPDILVLDIEMPGLNGLKALKLLRDQGFEGHVIVKTAYSRFAYAQDALHLHVDAYVLKPVKKVELKNYFDRILQTLKMQQDQGKKGELRRDFASGFVVSLVFSEKEDEQLFASDSFLRFREELPRRLSLICDFTLCPAEKNVLPLLIYSSHAMDEYVYRQLTADIEDILDDLSMLAFSRHIQINFGCLISDIHEQLPQTYLSARREKGAASEEEETSVSLHLNKVMSYIGQHFAEDISLESAAAYAKINPSYLSHLFKQEINQNFVEYLTEVRMKRAQELIRQGVDNVKELATKVGYQYPSYFCRQFKRYTGYTVSEYKRLI